uniref:TIL domain containing protein n=1 Tax=Rhipicephalus zambeziensis TaxID=60191 RepID=A0A224YRB5_9ACAR
MAKLLVAALVLVTVVAVLSAPSLWKPLKCAKGEEYRTVGACDPIYCPETRPTTPRPGQKKYIRPCSLEAILGCFCRKGLYRRKSDKKCVPMDQCWSS